MPFSGEDEGDGDRPSLNASRYPSNRQRQHSARYWSSGSPAHSSFVMEAGWVMVKGPGL